ncbi:hypothetical protein MUY14_16185 [Amycolatopsis sp. FBCC-B4732]|uniref:HD domain-containing phosphohydrolase n=1 Tax=Amycolatopsis sp. FBCC-B4732 TaxID=3079339 RepID=UPI001FF6CC87|nr:HD domain-containing phosphohydrolase [Amycolatopsis sp. FBCC-B4732]UOX92091.1 hypothetical protein MUY14_16185 [Amycolatopsis sp. FBCC-B4732]
MFLADVRGRMAALIHSHCTSADRLGLGDAVRDAPACTFERWDGSGPPAGARGDRLPIEMRVVHLRRGGPDAAVAVAEARAGSQFPIRPKAGGHGPRAIRPR